MSDDPSTVLEAGAIDVDEPAGATPEASALPGLLESVLFVSDGPVDERTLARVFGVRPPAVAEALATLRERLAERGVRLQIGPEGAQLVTAPEAADYIEGYLGLEQSRRLSNAALETLAVVAYRQPVTRATLESIRGVSSEGAIQTLRARGLIEDAGRAQGPGRPTLFVTTQRFLEHFGLEGASDLPAIGDYELPPPDAPQPLPGLGPGAARAEDVVADRLVRLARAAARSLPARTRPSPALPGATPALPTMPRTALPARREELPAPQRPLF